MIEFKTPEILDGIIIENSQKAQNEAAREAAGWEAWAAGIDHFLRTMPPRPQGFNTINHEGHERWLEADDHELSHIQAMQRNLRFVRDRADAHAAALRRAGYLAAQTGLTESSLVTEWMGARYFPCPASDESSMWFVVIDRDEDGTGYVEVKFQSEDFTDAADYARALNANPAPYPADGPHGQYIWASSRIFGDFDVVDRGDELAGWDVVEVCSTKKTAQDLARQFTSGERQRPTTDDSGRAW